MSEEKIKDPKRGSGIKHLVPCIRGFERSTILTPVFLIFEVLLEVLIPMLMAAIVDGGLYKEENFMLKDILPQALVDDRRLLTIVLGGFMILAALCSLSFGMLAAYTSAKSSMGFARNLRRRIFERTQDFSFANTDKFSAPTLVMRATTDVTSLQNTFSQLMVMLVRCPTMIIMAAVMAFGINSELSVVFVIALPVLLGAMVTLVLIGHPRFIRMLRHFDRMNADVQESVVGVREIKAFVREEHECEKFEESARLLQKMQVHAQKLFALSNPIQMGVMWTCTIVVLLLGGRLVLFEQSMNAGELVSLLSYTTQVISSLGMVAFMMIMLSMAKASLVRINEVLDEHTDIVGADSDLEVPDGSVRFENVDFSYTNDPENLNLSGINLSIAAGETIGVLGGTGEGKSSLVQLIPRFYDCLSGRVVVGGHDVRDYSLGSLRSSVSMVLQKNTLFSGTIRDNMRWGDAGADDAQIEEACRLACAHDFITSFPEGYDTVLGQGGVNLSGGQKQRLCIARAILKNPKILILDDSTSAVDTATDRSIRESLRTLMPGTTKIIIAQRIASVMDADRIVVLDEGTISDVGTHSELLARSKVYREVWESQGKEAADNGSAE